jgi:hypothetical protein
MEFGETADCKSALRELLAEQRDNGDLEAFEQAGAGTLARVPVAGQMVGAGFQGYSFSGLANSCATRARSRPAAPPSRTR